MFVYDSSHLGSITRNSLEDSFFSMVTGESRGSGTSSGGEAEQCPVWAAWKDLPGVMERIAKHSRICHLGKAGIDRQCLIDNADIIEPVLMVYGVLANSIAKL